MYPTDLTDSHWQIIKDKLDLKIANRKRKYELRVLINAILYVVKTGIQWRMLPNEYPPWQVVYYYHRIWSKQQLVKNIHDQILLEARKTSGKQACPSLGLIDSQSIKTASMTHDKGLDANKKISGRKRFIVTDTMGFVLGLVITSANVGERVGALLVLEKLKNRFPRLVKILADQGFDGKEFIAKVQQEYSWLLEIVSKVLGLSGFQVQPKRWIVERTFGWFSFHRRLVKDYEVIICNSESFIYWSMIRIMVRKC